MNKRIEELAEQAGAKIHKEQTRSGDWGDFSNYDSFDHEKFAKLIVKECMDIVSKQTTLDTNEDFREGFSHGRKLAWTEIRKHFGVKE